MRSKGVGWFVFFPAILAQGSLIAADAPNRSNFESFSKLRSLPVPHYSWPIKPGTVDQKTLVDFVRITHGYSMQGYAVGNDALQLRSAAIKEAVVVSNEVRKLDTGLDPGLAINYSVWHYAFPRNIAPFENSEASARELDLLRRNLVSIKEILSETNQDLKGRLKVKAILFDAEAFRVRQRGVGPQWNQAITEKHSLAFRVAKEVFPSAQVEWYGRGGFRKNFVSGWWQTLPYFTLNEPGASYSVPLYSLPDEEVTNVALRKTIDFARDKGIEEVTPWVALASGYAKDHEGTTKWLMDWRYPVDSSWNVGRQIAKYIKSPATVKERIPKPAVSTVIFYPEPFGRAPAWAEHFIAYVQGIHGSVLRLPER